MGLQYRRRLKVLPGVKMNVTQRGIRSFTIGRRGASLNVNRKGWAARLSLIGTGLSYLFRRRPW